MNSKIQSLCQVRYSFGYTLYLERCFDEYNWIKIRISNPFNWLMTVTFFFLYNNSFSIICNNFWFINLFLYLKMLILLYFINLLYYINIFNLYWKITTFYHHIRILSIARIEIYTRFKLHDNINHLTFNTPTARQNYTCSRQFL